MQHVDLANRARNLAEYLRAAMLLANVDAYAPAFASVRMALEHMLVDHLVFSGRRYIRIIVGVKDATWTEWRQRRAAGDDFTEVLDWCRKKDTVEITYEGLRSTPDADGQSYIISPHYFLLSQYQPYLGPASAQAEFDDGIGEPAHDREFAKENELVYRTYLSWSSIKRNLALNGLRRCGRALDVSGDRGGGDSMVLRFNTARPCLPRYHYMIPAVGRLPEVPGLVAQLGYFVVHAPRQTGKTNHVAGVGRRVDRQR